MSTAKSNGSYSLNPFAAFLDQKLYSSQGNSKKLVSEAYSNHPKNMTDPNSSAAPKKARKGDKQCVSNTAKDIPEDILDGYRTPAEETPT